MRKIAVAAAGSNPDSPISDLAARAPFVQIFNDKGDLLEIFENPFAMGGGGAGMAIAKIMNDKGITDFIATKAGPNFDGALSSYGITLHIVPLGLSVGEAIKRV